MTLQEIADKIASRADGSGFDGSVKLDLGGDGVIVIDGSGVSTAEADADCTIALSRDDLEALIAGDLSPTAAFMQGKLKVDGDMSVAMQLGQVF